MKNKLLLLLLLPAMIGQAQHKMLSIEDAVLRQRSSLAPERLEQLNWIKGSENYFFIKKEKDESWLMIGAPGKSLAQKKLSLIELQGAVSGIRTTKPVELKGFPYLSWKSKDEMRFTVGELMYTYNLSTKKIIAEDAGAGLERKDEAEKTGYIAYTKENNLFIRKNGTDVQVSSDSDPGVVNGQSVHRDEFGIHKGTFWSPSGKLLAYYRMDQTMVTDYPVMDLTQQPAKAEMIKYPMAGARSHEVTIGIYNAETGKTIFLKTGEPKEQYLTNIAWSPDEKNIYVVVLNRDQNHLWVNRYNAASGDFEKTLFEETHDKYVHPMHAMLFVPGKPDQFVWQSERFSADNPKGLNTLYLYDTSGKLIRMLSNPKDIQCNACLPPMLVTDVYGFDAKGAKLFYQVTTNGVNRKIYAADISKEPTLSSVTLLTPAEGTHYAVFNDKRTFFIDHYASNTVPREQNMVNASGKMVSTLLKASNPLSDYKQCTIELSQMKAADNETTLWTRTIYPPEFNRGKKYPVLVYTYNGPGVQLITDTWLCGADMFLYYMAQQGYIVFTVDGRGSQGRGLAFEQSTFRKLGTEEINDQEKAALYLKTLPYVDDDRMAVYGWSYGGFMTTSLMTRKPGVFSVGVAGGPVIDWSYYEVMYTERYMDTPQSNKEGYDESNLLNHVDKLKGKLLLIHGTSDDVVVWQHSLVYLEKAVKKGVLLDYFVYPGHQHNVAGKDRVHLMQKIADYIVKNTQ